MHLTGRDGYDAPRAMYHFLSFEPDTRRSRLNCSDGVRVVRVRREPLMHERTAHDLERDVRRNDGDFRALGGAEAHNGLRSIIPMYVCSAPSTLGPELFTRSLPVRHVGPARAIDVRSQNGSIEPPGRPAYCDDDLRMARRILARRAFCPHLVCLDADGDRPRG